MEDWALVRTIHLLAVVFFVGGQLTMTLAVLPAARRHGVAPEPVREIAKRFGIGSAVAIAVVVVTGIALAEHFQRWEDWELHAKIGLLLAILALTGLHVRLADRRWLSLSLLGMSLAVVWFGVALAHTV